MAINGLFSDIWTLWQTPIRYRLWNLLPHLTLWRRKSRKFRCSTRTYLDTEGIEEEILATDAYMLEIDIKLRMLRTVRSEKEGGLQSSSVVTMPRSELSVHTPSAHSAEPINEKHAQLNLQNNSQTLSDISYVSNSSQNHRLPKLSLPTFNGDILHFGTRLKQLCI
ncbi:hypothetical protein DPMN_168933 [Dreissena polymorpha]|uniref:Uncharacterized protein n=1 Tax=Dreissena polymorpha TaxID=45954 RepID=A0A9D4F3M9_DREPO|nr:hypothetical protein DPMN_168933 [Dreissena polymorpha]